MPESQINQPQVKVAHVIRVFSYGGAEVCYVNSFTTKEFKKEVISDVFVLDHIKLGLKMMLLPTSAISILLHYYLAFLLRIF